MVHGAIDGVRSNRFEDPCFGFCLGLVAKAPHLPLLFPYIEREMRRESLYFASFTACLCGHSWPKTWIDVVGCFCLLVISSEPRNLTSV